MDKGSAEIARNRIPELRAVIRACCQDLSTIRTKCRVVNAILVVKGREQPEAASQSFAL